MSIFNRRRRPRQAVYASPENTVKSTPFHLDIPDEALLEVAENAEKSAKNYFSSRTPSPLSSFQNSRPAKNRQPSTLQKHPNNNFYGNEYLMPKKPKLEVHKFEGKTSCLSEQNSEVHKFAKTTNSFSSNLLNSTKRSFYFGARFALLIVV